MDNTTGQQKLKEGLSREDRKVFPLPNAKEQEWGQNSDHTHVHSGAFPA